ncbi:MAG: alanyl-tRNA editing protein [Candidatus Thermoplasmatota archaeon]|nr:alanyl-tRNA editing protein [Candidatus Thermoplasmatota archaeon]
METKLLYLDDQYRKECESTALWHEFTDLVIDESIFYPTGEGQPNDRGRVKIDGKEYVIVDTWSDGDNVHLMSHDTFPDDIDGKKVQQILDWDVRYLHMRFRTALKMISGVAFKLFGATTRINQTYDDQAWFDLEMDEITQENVDELFRVVNKVAQEGKDVKFRLTPRDEFLREEQMMKICKGRVPDYDQIRVLEIDGVPDQMEFGTNVKNTREIGPVEFKTNLVKGKISRRINITLK